MPSVDIKKIMGLLCAVSFFVSFVSAADDAYVKSLEKALVEKITHDSGARGGVSSGGAQANSSNLPKNNNNMVGAAVVAKLAEARNALLDALSLSEFSSAADGISRLERGIAAANSFSACLTMLRSSSASAGVVQAPRPMNVPGMTMGVKPVAMPAVMPVQKPIGMGMPGTPVVVQPAKSQMPTMPLPIKPVTSLADEEEDDEEEAPAAPAPVVGGMPGVKPLVPAQGGMPGMMPAQAPRQMVPAQPMMPAAQPAKPMVPVQPMRMPGMPR